MKTNIPTYEQLLQKVNQQENELLKLKNLVELTPVAMHFYSLKDENNLILTGANPIADEILGIKHEQLIGKTIEQAFPELLSTEISNIYKKIAKGEIKSHAFEIPYKDDRFSGYYNVYVFSLQNNQIAVKFFDISKNKKHELDILKTIEKAEQSKKELLLKKEEYESLNEELRQTNEELFIAKEKLKTVLDSNPFPIAVVDVNDDNIIFWSKSAVQLFGHDPKTTKEWYELAYPNSEYRKNVIKRWKSFLEIAQNSYKAINTGEYEIYCKNGTVKICELYAQFIPGNLIVTLNDISDRKLAEKELIKAKEKAEENEANLQIKNEEYESLNEELKQTNEELSIAKEIAEISEAKYATAFLTSPDAVNINAIDGTYIEINEGFTALTGYTKEDVIGVKSTEIEIWNIPKDREILLNTLKEQGKIENLESVFKCKDGSLKTALMSASIIKIKNKPHILSVTRDISDRKKIENEIIQAKEKAEENELKFSELFNQLADAIFIFDPENYDIIEANKATSEIYGYDETELIGMSCLKFSSEVEKSKSASKIAQEKGKEFINFRNHVKKDGTEIFTQLFVSKITVNNKTLMFAVSKDITDKVKAEQELLKAKEKAEQNKKELLLKNEEYESLNEELRQTNEELLIAMEKAEESKARFDLAMDASKDGIFDWNLITNEIYYSPGWKSILGYKDDELPNDFTIWENLTEPEDAAKSWEMQQKVIKKQLDRFEFEFKMKHKDGHWVDILSRAEAVFDKNDKAIRIVGTHVDISERKRSEIELLIAKDKAEESDRLKTEFINNMSHEIRTPMNGILGFSSLLDKPNITEEKRKHFVSIIQNSGTQLMRIIDDILEISRLGTKQVEAIEKETCLNEMFLELFSIFDIKAKENKIPLFLKKGLSVKESTIFTDETKLHKILSNLIENALKFTKEGFIEFGYNQKNNELEIYVKDTGVGINPEMHQSIFERFSQEEKELSRKVGGLGLGLSIAKENTELLGGKIELKSEKGKGTTFFVTIPYKPANSNTKKSNSNNIIEKNEIDKYTILIVEDEEVNYLYLETLLAEEIEINCNIIHAKNGEEAVDICKKNSEIDLVLMDIKMPIMNGFEATKLIKEFRPNLPIVAQTAYSTMDEKEKAFSVGCTDFISKPISEETLNIMIKKYLIEK